MNPDKLLTLLMGRCWHEPEAPKIAYSNCIHCGIEMLHWPDPIGWKPRDEDENEPNPYFSDPHHRDEFFTWLTRERGEMWHGFVYYQHNFNRDCTILDWGNFIPWLFFSDPSRPRDLMAEWLRLDSTIKRFGWEECPNCKDQPIKGYGVWFETGICPVCNGSGKVFAPWAQYVKEGTI